MYKENLNKLALYSFYTIVFISIFYFWTVSEGRFEFFLRGEESHYNYLTHSFLNKKLSLPFTPKKELLEMSNPYDSSKNKKFRDKGLHDLSLYKDKLYLYFGPTPALLLYMPYHFIAKILHVDYENNKFSAKKYLSNRLCALILATLILIVSSIILIHLAITYFNKIPIWIVIFSIMVLGFSNLNSYLLRRPHTYEIAILCGSFCQLTSILMFLFFINKKKIIYLGIGSLFLGLAVGSRLNLTISSFAVLLYLLYFLKKENLIRFSTIVSLISPFLLIISGLGLYNYFRFGNFFECGFQYQLNNFSTPHLYTNTFIFKRTCLNIYVYLFSPLFLNKEFPFIHLNSNYEWVSGSIFMVPFSFVVLWIYLLINLRIKENFNFQPYLILLFITFIVNQTFILLYRSIAQRHTGDYYSLMIILSALLWFQIYSLNSLKNKSRLLTNLIIVIFGCVSILTNIAISIEGPDKPASLRNSNPKEFKKLENLIKDNCIIKRYLDLKDL